MKSRMGRTAIREIRGSFGRFFAIMAIVALGVGFFSGLKITKQAMVVTVDNYLRDQNFYDFHLLSTLGFEEADVQAFMQETEVQYAEGMYIFDALYSGIGENEVVLKSISIPEHINGIHVVSGRMPETATECVVDSRMNGIELGMEIQLTGSNEQETMDVFTETVFTVVGIVDSSYYLNFERGTTSLGTGKVNGFVYLQDEVFDCDYYTDVFICFQQDYAIYSKEYEDYIDKKTEQWEDICADRAEVRYYSVLEDARKELEDAKEELRDAKEDIKDGREELERQREDGKEQLESAYRKLVDAEAQSAEGREQWDDAWKTIQEREEELVQREGQLNEKEQELLLQEQEWNTVWQQLTPEQQIMLQQLEQGKAAIVAAKTEIAAGRAQIEEGKEELNSREKELRAAETETKRGWREYNEKKVEFDEEISKAEKELADAEEAIEEGEAELADAQRKVDEIEKPDSYVLDRNTNIGYACFESDSDIVDAIAKVFPIFFILVAALVCMTTMNRMVEEQRTQIGVLKALGYSEAAIMGKFMFYSGSAALLGCIIGYAAGTYVFPQVIWTAYSMMYQTMELKYIFNWVLAGIALLVSVLCSMGTTWLTCRYELMETAANLMRAKAPRAGKRVFLERIPFIWKRLKFLHKVSVRNIFRYKKRFFMMVIGISGCTALLLTGFGIKDSIADFAEQQFEEIQILDGTVVIKNPIRSGSVNALTDKLDSVAEDYTYVSETSWEMVFDGNVKSVNLVIPEYPEEMGNYMDFHTDKKVPLMYPSQGQALINSGLADRYRIEVGDTIILRDDSMREISVTVSGIFKNYVYNYVFLSPETYEEAIGNVPEYKTVYVNFKTGMDVHQAAADLMKEKQVSTITIHRDSSERLTNMMGSLNYVVILVIVCAAALAFIVLYNLTNINITERIREIATIKVLGFFRNETESYVFRENMVLTAIGIFVGLGLGILLHSFVMNQIQVDMVSFDVRILPLSYLYSILLTFVFYYLVNRVMSLKLEQINMAESLKSVE